MWRDPHDPWNWPYLGGPPPGRFSRLVQRLGIVSVSIAYALMGVVIVVLVVGAIVGAVWFS